MKLLLQLNINFSFIDISTTTISSSISPSPPVQLIHSSSQSSLLVSKTNLNRIHPMNTTVSTSTLGNSEDDVLTATAAGACTRIEVNGFVPAREFAFIDCSEVYLAGKRTSGIYEIW